MRNNYGENNFSKIWIEHKKKQETIITYNRDNLSHNTTSPINICNSRLWNANIIPDTTNTITNKIQSGDNNKMNKKLEKWIRQFVWKGMIKANNINKRMGVDLGEERLSRWLDKYIKFLNIAFKFITGFTFSATFLWFFPTYIGIGWERTIAVLLVIIIAMLRVGTIKVKVEWRHKPKSIKKDKQRDNN